MFARIDANKSTKGASKLRRDLINAEIANLRDLLPLPQSTRQRLSQLQLMALVCVYVRKANYFQQVFKRHDMLNLSSPTPNIGFSKALSGFLMMLTQNGKLLYISDNAAEYLGHSMEDLLIHGDSVYDIIDKQDHNSIQSELSRSVPQGHHNHQHPLSHHHLHHSHSSPGHNSPTTTVMEGEQRMFLCRMNVSRNARRQMRFGDQKVVLVQGHYLSYLPLCSRNEPVFVATCTPIAMPETRECVVQGATNVFTTIHSMDMRVAHIDKNGEFHLGYKKSDVQGISWYQMLHWDSTKEAQAKHRLITQSEQDRSGILLVRMQKKSGDFVWVHCVLQVRDGQDANQQPVIVCTNQVLSEKEASVLLTNSWLYHYYSVQSKIQFGLSYDTQQHPNMSPRLAPPHSPSLLQQQQHQPHLHHHQFYAAASPIQPQALNHHHLPYGSPHYNYGYPTTIHGGGGGGVVGGPASNGSTGAGQQTTHHHNNNNNSHIIMNLNGFETVSKEQTANGNIVEDRPKTPQTPVPVRSTTTSKRRAELSPSSQSTVSSKKRAISRLEPIYIPDQSSSPQEDSMTELRNGFGGENSNQTVVMGTISYGRPRTKFVSKLQTTPLMDATEFIEQWNPSPPWSEAAQKVPDIGPQELSPYMTTTTPPTPNSANIITPMAVSASHLSSSGLSGPKSSSATANGSLSGHGSAFSFDWVPEQFVPVATTDCSLTLPPPPPPPINCVSFLPQELSIHQSHRSFSHWPSPAMTTALPSSHNHHHSMPNHYEEVHQVHHLHQLQQEHNHRGVNLPISGDILLSSGAAGGDKTSNNGRDSSDEERVHHHPKGH